MCSDKAVFETHLGYRIIILRGTFVLDFSKETVIAASHDNKDCLKYILILVKLYVKLCTRTVKAKVCRHVCM